jgi:CHAT domain-containing protein/class 3 adenylate cyclase
MTEKISKKPEGQPGKIEEILHEKERLDQIIKEKFQKKMTILFSDVCGFTKYIDTWGDIRGRAWIQKHHDIVLPAIENSGGRTLEILGDGVLACFSTTLSAVRASLAIQNGLNKHNAESVKADEIHVKIGINTGELLFDGERVSGDVVNVASRVQGQAGPDQILIDKSVYEEVCGSDDILCRRHITARVKGKPEPLELYRVVWQDENIIVTAEPRVRTLASAREKRVKVPKRVLQLEATREKDHLKISAHEQSAGEVSTVRHYEEIPVPIDRVGRRCREMVETLNNVNRKGRLTHEVLIKLRENGQVLRDDLFTHDVKKIIKETQADHLILNLDDQLVNVPWELLHDGQKFLCQRFSMGRLVKTRQNIIDSRTRSLARPFKMLILADPKGDLKGAYKEGIQIRDFMERYKDFLNVSFKSDNITTDFIKEKIRNFDLVHFAGHAEYNPKNSGKSGWRLSDGLFKAWEITKLAGTATMPALIFSNACQSARTEKWHIKAHFQDEIFGLANAFILAGVKHYVGTFWEILDEPSSRFALECYKQALSGVTVGEAIRQARLSLIQEYGEETIVWASYLLYGDPTFNYLDQVVGAEAEEPPESVRVAPVVEEVRTREEVIDFGEQKVRKKQWAWSALAAGVVLILFMLWGYPGFLREDIAKYETQALAYYQEGKFDEALNACQRIEDSSSKIRLAHLIKGNIYLRRGELDVAAAAYQKALQAPKGTEVQKAEAFRGLGRIASLRKDPEGALQYYQQATQTAPASKLGYLSQAPVLMAAGRFAEALPLLEKARRLAPNDQALAAITNDTRRQAVSAHDDQKQERIDRLVKELLDTMKAPPRALPSDGWTSPPLSMWIMDFQTQGYSLQEGEEMLLAAGISEQLLQNSRVQLVERALLDRLLEELKLGTSAMIDRSTALSLGRLVAARLILSGRVIYTGPQTQVSLRIIETETGRITAAFTEAVGSAAPVSVLTDRLSESLIAKFKKLYPLRGKILSQNGREVRTNLGQKLGLQVGQQLKVINEDVTLEVIMVQPEKSLAKIVKGQKALQEDQRVEAVY